MEVVRVITQANFTPLVDGLELRLRRAGLAGVPLSEMDAVDAYLSAVLTAEGKCVLVTRGDRQAVVHRRHWQKPYDSPFIEEV